MIFYVKMCIVLKSMKNIKEKITNYKIFVFVVLFLLTLFLGYAVGRGYRNYELKKESVSTNDSKKETKSLESNSYEENTEVFPGWKIPKVSLSVSQVAKDGYNLKINTISYWFTPDDIGQNVVPNRGYADIFINNKKVSRAYSNINFLSNNLFDKGTNTITVVLVANDGSAWITKGDKKPITGTASIFVK